MNELTHGVSSDVPPHTNRKAPATWHQHDWRAIHRGVKRLQVRIAKAAQLGRMRELRNLQRLLSHSYHAKLLAVKRVTENRGKKTPGVDGVRWSTPQDKSRAVEDLNQAGYKPQPLRRVWILKRDGKSKRPLGIPTMKDRAMQALHLLTLEPVAETTGDLNSYGFRRFRCCQDAIEQAFRVLAGRNSAQWVLNADIQACFDALAHDWLLSHIPMNHSILRKWLKAGILEDGVFQNTDRGTPQGGVISPCLMNMALDGLERTLHQAFRPKGRNPDKVNFIRYADDFIITGARRELLQEQVTARLRDFLGMRGLRLSEQKTTITKIEEGSDFLSFNLRKYRGKLLIKPARSAIKGIQQKIRAILATRKAARAVDVIAILNPILRGWAQYHRHVVSKEIFKALDHWLWGRIWRWSCRRHTRKSATWIRQKYFCHHEGKNWVFFGRVEDGKELRLLRLADIPITRHRKIRSSANPYFARDELYFERREAQQWLQNAKIKYLRTLYLQQKGKCLVCHQQITSGTNWNIHHIKARYQGGGSNLANLVLLHPNCHRQIHALDIPVSKSGIPPGCLRRA